MESGRVCSTPYILNNLPDKQRDFLMRKNIRDEISKFAGVDISIRGRYIKPTKDGTIVQGNDLPLHLLIAGHSKNNVARAMEKIEFLVKTESTGTEVVDTEDSSLVEKIDVGIDMCPPAFGIKAKLLGENDTNVKYIESETGAVISLQGKGSGYPEKPGEESTERLHILVKYKTLESKVEARQLVLHLIETVQQDFLEMYGTKFGNPKKPEVLPVGSLQKIAKTPPPPAKQDKVVDNLTTTFEKIVLGLDRVPPAFHLKHKIYGKNLTNVKHIGKTTGAKILLGGIGYDFDKDNESNEPPYILVKYLKPELKETARRLILNLIDAIHEEFVTLYGIYAVKPRVPEIIPLKNLPSASNISAPSSASNFSKSTESSDQEKSSKLKASRVVSKFARRDSSDESNQSSPPPPPPPLVPSAASPDFIGIPSSFSPKPPSPPPSPVLSKRNVALRKLASGTQSINSPSSIAPLGTQSIPQEEVMISEERSPPDSGNEMETMNANGGGDGRHRSRRDQWRQDGRSRSPSGARQREYSDGCSQSQSRRNMERCYECHDNGHLARDCPNEGLIKCYSCQRYGNHISSQCPEKGGHHGSQRRDISTDILSESGRSRSRSGTRQKDLIGKGSQLQSKRNMVRCYECQDYGHLARECPNVGLIKRYSCKRFGQHISFQCPKNSGDLGSQRHGGSGDTLSKSGRSWSRSDERQESYNPGRSQSESKRGEGRCYACGDYGHLAQDCFNEGLIKCYVCNSFGQHISFQCPKNSGNLGSQRHGGSGDILSKSGRSRSRSDKRQEAYNPGRSQSESKRGEGRCYACGDYGHLAQDCFNEGLIKCYVCNSFGQHISSQCPENTDYLGSQRPGGSSDILSESGRSRSRSGTRQKDLSGKGSRLQSKRNMVRCYECQDNGHRARECPNVGLIKCYSCKRFGQHISFQCPENSGDLGSQRHSGSGDILSKSGRSWSRSDKRQEAYNPGRSQSESKRGEGPCYACGDYGHLAQDCFNEGLIKCYMCNRFGYHISIDCPENVNNQGSRRLSSSSDNWSQSGTSRSRSSERQEGNSLKRSRSKLIGKKGKCYKCHDNGHLARDCPHEGLIKCYVCQRFGHHISTECPRKNIHLRNQKGGGRKDNCKQDRLSQSKSGAKKVERRKAMKRCFQCHDNGHLAQDCPNGGLIKCYACKRLGNHISTECPENIDSRGS